MRKDSYENAHVCYCSCYSQSRCTVSAPSARCTMGQ